jgi:uncharacterized protein (TIGR00251 family)
LNFRIEGNTVSFWMRVKPRSTRERLTLDSAGGLSLEVSAPPIEGEANEASIRFLARALRLPETSVTIRTGKKSRRKLIRIIGRSAREIVDQLEALASTKEEK